MTKKKTKKQLVKEQLDELFYKKELATSLEVYSTDNTFKEYSYDVKLVSEYIKENKILRDTRKNLHPTIQDMLPGVHNRSVIYFRSGTLERLIRESTIDKILNDKS
jgi:AICAR transformylase/IMP cyclohydrolase PurH